MRSRRAALVLIGVSAVALAMGFGAAAAEPSLIGIWFSGYQPDEPGVMSLIEFKADGTFREEFRKCENGMVVGFQVQSGTWSLANGIERTMTDRINGDVSAVEDVYQIELLTEAERRIRLQPQGYVFSSRKVAKFEFPECASGV